MSGVNAVVLIKAETSLINELAEQLAEVPGVAEDLEPDGGASRRRGGCRGL